MPGYPGSLAYWLVMDAPDLNRRIIGLLTLAYNALPHLEQSEVDEDFAREFGATVDSLMAGWTAGYSLDVDLPPRQRAGVDAALQRLAREVSGDLTAIFGMFTGIFVRLCQEFEDKCPDAGIPELLQELGLDAASEELPENPGPAWCGLILIPD